MKKNTDEEYKKYVATQNRRKAIIMITFSVATIIFSVFLAIYAFANPDPSAWYLKEQKTLVGTEPATGVDSNSYTDIHGKLIWFFIWMFAS